MTFKIFIVDIVFIKLQPTTYKDFHISVTYIVLLLVLSYTKLLSFVNFNLGYQ